MRVLCVAPYFYPKPGGLERYAYEICKRIAEENEVRAILRVLHIHTL
jgi:glycosyltransferase involved in cell wall biosynthesis